MKQLSILTGLLFCCSCHTSKIPSRLGNYDTEYIQKMWRIDSCGSMAHRDMIARKLINDKEFLSLNDSQMSILLGKPTWVRTDSANDMKYITYVLVADTLNGKCDFTQGGFVNLHMIYSISTHNPISIKIYEE